MNLERNCYDPAVSVKSGGPMLTCDLGRLQNKSILAYTMTMINFTGSSVHSLYLFRKTFLKPLDLTWP